MKYFAVFLILLCGISFSQTPTPFPTLLPPDLIYPENESVFTSSSGEYPIEFDWSDVNDADSYEFVIESFDGSFLDHEYDISDSGFTYIIRNSDYYFWKVRTYNFEGVPGNYSETRGFEFIIQTPVPTATPDPNLESPQQLSPLDYETFIIPNVDSKYVEFEWTPVQGAVYYELEIFSGDSFYRVEEAQETTFGRYFNNINRNFYWRVYAVFGDGSRSVSKETWHFSIYKFIPDFNDDNKIDYIDLFNFSNAWYNLQSGKQYLPEADFNSDGIINSEDMIWFLERWDYDGRYESQIDPPTPTPTPDSSIEMTLLSPVSYAAFAGSDFAEGVDFDWEDVAGADHYEIDFDWSPAYSYLDSFHVVNNSEYTYQDFLPAITEDTSVNWGVVAVMNNGGRSARANRDFFVVVVLPTLTPTP